MPDYARVLDSLKDKLKRQEGLAQETRDHIAMLEKVVMGGVQQDLPHDNKKK